MLVVCLVGLILFKLIISTDDNADTKDKKLHFVCPDHCDDDCE
jgi:hypothetical protein